MRRRHAAAHTVSVGQPGRAYRGADDGAIRPHPFRLSHRLGLAVADGKGVAGRKGVAAFLVPRVSCCYLGCGWLGASLGVLSVAI